MTRAPERKYKYYDMIMAAFCTVLICSNMIGAAKVVQLWGFTFGAGILFFPISYFFGDVLTEVYGYARDRKVIWTGFGALMFASVLATVVVAFPPAPGWPHQKAFEIAFGQAPRIALSSLCAFWCGSFANSVTLAKLKIKTEGRFLWMRTIGSTAVGELVDSMIFYPLAFWGIWSNDLVIKVMITNYLMKTLWEVIATPMTYKVVGFLKRVEHEDYYDRDTNFTPFSLEA